MILPVHLFLQVTFSSVIRSLESPFTMKHATHDQSICTCSWNFPFHAVEPYVGLELHWLEFPFLIVQRLILPVCRSHYDGIHMVSPIEKINHGMFLASHKSVSTSFCKTVYLLERSLHFIAAHRPGSFVLYIGQIHQSSIILNKFMISVYADDPSTGFSHA